MNHVEMKDITVIIVNYNTKDITKACIDSIFDFTKKVTFEVVLVDNASTDGSKQLFEDDKRITYIYNSVNYGFGKANNIGAKVAKGKYLFFLNSDTYFKNDALSLFFDYAEKDKPLNVGFLGTVLFDTEGKPNGFGGIFPTLKNGLLSALHMHREREFSIREPFASFKVDYVLGADVFTKKDLFDSLGGFDEDFFMYYEESDLMRRAKRKGALCEIIDGPKIVHLEGKSTGKVSHRKRMMVEKSHILHLKKHYPLISFKLFLFVYTILKLSCFLNKHYTKEENREYIGMLLKS